jgi:hypothetical protein
MATAQNNVVRLNAKSRKPAGAEVRIGKAARSKGVPNCDIETSGSVLSGCGMWQALPRRTSSNSASMAIISEATAARRRVCRSGGLGASQSPESVSRSRVWA